MQKLILYAAYNIFLLFGYHGLPFSKLQQKPGLISPLFTSIFGQKKNYIKKLLK